MFEDGELERFDNYVHEIIKEYSKLIFKEKDQILTQRIIINQEKEIELLQHCLSIEQQRRKKIKKELQQKENTIKEAIKYIKMYSVFYEDEDTSYFEKAVPSELLNILDKEDKQ